jgi:hypothetical protein
MVLWMQGVAEVCVLVVRALGGTSFSESWSRDPVSESLCVLAGEVVAEKVLCDPEGLLEGLGDRVGRGDSVDVKSPNKLLSWAKSLGWE